MTDFSELLQELLKAGQSKLSGFEIHQIFFQLNSSLLKSGQHRTRHFESWPGPSKAFANSKAIRAEQPRIYYSM
jgi:hypothetical protein